MIRTLDEVIEATKELLVDKFPSKAEFADEVIDVILAKALIQFRLDLANKSWLKIYQQYALPKETLECEDITKTQLELLINESKLGERDTAIAKLYYIQKKSEDIISQELEIDKKTVHSNIPKISNQLKRTAQQLYKG